MLVAALGTYAGLAATTVREVGLVGEVAASWATAEPPDVRPALDRGGVAWRGPLRVSGTRPQLAVDAGVGLVPLAVNAYTGGLADVPARVARAVTGDWRAGVVSTVALGALLLSLAWRFLRFHGTETAAGAAAWLLATDWSFQFYRKALGGTEVLLHAAGLLVVWSLWSRRWKGGVHGTVAIAVGVGLGLHAKLTFVATLAAFALTAWAMRWDRAALKPPRRVAWWLLAAIPALGVAPLLLDHALQVAHPELAVRSHDTLAVQLARYGFARPVRESAMNLAYFFGTPAAFLPAAYRGEPIPPVSLLRLLGFGIALGGVALEWRSRTPTAGAALLRFLSVAVPLQVGFLFAANRDLHHLAQATPMLLLLVALAADRLAAEWAPPRSAFRGLVTGLLVLPHLAAGILQLRATDDVLAALPASTFTETGQRELAGLAAACPLVYTSDYEAHGMLDARVPGTRFVHLWGAVANGERDPRAVVEAAAGACYLSIRPTAPLVYDLHPSQATVALPPIRDIGWAQLYEVPP